MKNYKLASELDALVNALQKIQAHTQQVREIINQLEGKNTFEAEILKAIRDHMGKQWDHYDTAVGAAQEAGLELRYGGQS